MCTLNKMTCSAISIATPKNLATDRLKDRYCSVQLMNVMVMTMVMMVIMMMLVMMMVMRMVMMVIMMMLVMMMVMMIIILLIVKGLFLNLQPLSVQFS